MAQSNTGHTGHYIVQDGTARGAEGGGGEGGRSFTVPDSTSLAWSPLLCCTQRRELGFGVKVHQSAPVVGQ